MPFRLITRKRYKMERSYCAWRIGSHYCDVSVTFPMIVTDHICIQHATRFLFHSEAPKMKPPRLNITADISMNARDFTILRWLPPSLLTHHTTGDVVLFCRPLQDRFRRTRSILSWPITTSRMFISSSRTWVKCERYQCVHAIRYHWRSTRQSTVSTWLVLRKFRTAEAVYGIVFARKRSTAESTKQFTTLDTVRLQTVSAVY